VEAVDPNVDEDLSLSQALREVVGGLNVADVEDVEDAEAVEVEDLPTSLSPTKTLFLKSCLSHSSSFLTFQISLSLL